MSKKLSDEDRRAIDMLLNRANEAKAGRISPRRIAAAAKILSALDAYPTPEPSKDLVERTLRHIDRAAIPLPTPDDSITGFDPGLLA
ncbi:MAG: hypothetical protein ABSG31_16440 [Tepidisphaeraceae bacterium]|jgi:hypothetical protein